jgi:hypothetical protein
VSTQLSSPEEARDLGVRMAGVDPATVVLTEDPNVRVDAAWVALADPDSPDYAKRVAESKAHQKAYRFKNCDGVAVTIVVDKFRDGWCCWGVLPNGYCVRF